MRFFDFLDLTFRTLSKRVATEKDFSIAMDGKIKAIHMIIGLMRGLAKYAAVPVIFTEFVAVRLGLREPPIDPLLVVKPELKIADGEPCPSSTEPPPSAA